MGDVIALKRAKSGALLCKRPGCKIVVDPAYDRRAREQGIISRRHGYCFACAVDAEEERRRYQEAMKPHG